MIRRYNNLNDREQEAYMSVLEAIHSFKTQVTIPIRDGHELYNIYKAIRYDYPETELMWDYRQSSYWLNNIGNSVKDMTLFLKYHGSKKEIEEKMKRIDQKAEEIIKKSLAGRTLNDFQCAEAVYKYMSNHFHYSVLRADGKYPGYAYTLECILYGNGVCAGISCAYSYVLRKLQIPIMVIVGNADGGNSRGSHAWNIMQLADGSFKHMDLTWETSARSEKYMVLDDLAMKARRHQWVMTDYPLCS